MNVFLAVIGCGCGDEPSDETPDPPPICSAENHSQVSSAAETGISSPRCGGLELGNFRVLGEGTFTIDLFSDGERVIPHIVAESDGSVFRGLQMTGTFTLDGEEPVRLWRQAYASGPSAIEELPDTVALDNDGVPILEGEPPGTSAWAGLVGRHGGASALVGVHSAVGTRFAAAFAADGTVHAVWGGQGEELPLDEGNELFLDPLFLAMGPDPNVLWETWVAAVAENADIVPRPAPLPLGYTVTLYGGYYEIYTVSVAVANMVALQDDPRVVAPTVLLVELSEYSTSSTAEIANEILTAGLVPALHLAPFTADSSAPIVTEHPDWWVTDGAGAPILVDGLVALDVTHAEAAAAVSAQVQDVVSDGWRVLVLDHLDAAAVEGVRSAPTTGTLAYRSALELVRSAAGDAWMTAMEAPLLPSAGLVDGYRFTPECGGWELAGRAFTSGVWWWIDYGRIPGMNWQFDPNPLTGETIAAALAGGTWQVESLTNNTPITLSPDLFALSATGGRPLDPLAATGPPFQWEFGTGEVALINWASTQATIWGPGGEEVLTGEIAEAGQRELESGAGEVWIPDE